MVPITSSNRYISTVRISTTGSGILSGHAGLRLGTGVTTRTGGTDGLAAPTTTIGHTATTGTTAILTARSAMLRVRVLPITICVTPWLVANMLQPIVTVRSSRATQG